jgi:hypothetical protein
LAVTGTVNPVPEAPTMGGEGNVYCGSGTITAAVGNHGNAIRWDDQTTDSPRTVHTTGTWNAVTTSADGCESAPAGVTVSINQASGNGAEADAVCGCAYGLTKCSNNICRTLTTTYQVGACTGSCGYQYRYEYDECGVLVNTGTVSNSACTAGCDPCASCSREQYFSGRAQTASNCNNYCSNYSSLYGYSCVSVSYSGDQCTCTGCK